MGYQPIRWFCGLSSILSVAILILVMDFSEETWASSWILEANARFNEKSLSEWHTWHSQNSLISLPSHEKDAVAPYLAGSIWGRGIYLPAAAGEKLTIRLSKRATDDCVLFVWQDNQLVFQGRGGFAQEGRRDLAEEIAVAFSVTLPSIGPSTWLLGVAGGKRWDLHPILTTSQDFHTLMDHEGLLISGFFGFIIAITLFNLLLFVASGNTLYMWYAASTFFLHGITSLEVQGYPSWILLGDMPWLRIRFSSSVSGIGVLFSVKFAYLFLDFEKNPTISRLVRYAERCLVAAIVGVFFFYGPSANLLCNILLGVLGIAVITYAILTAIKGSRQARIFVIAWLPLTVFGIGILGSNFKLWPGGLFFRQGLFLSCAWEVLMLSFGLAERLRALQNETLAAQNQALHAHSVAEKARQGFVKRLAEEFLVPLQGLVAALQPLRDEIDLPRDGWQRHLAIIAEQTARLQALSLDLMSLVKFTGLPVGDVEPVSLTEIIEGAIEDASFARGEIPNLEVATPQDQWVLAPKVTVQRILFHLWDGLRKSYPGRIRLSALAEPAGVRVSLQVLDPEPDAGTLNPGSLPGESLGFAVAESLLRQLGAAMFTYKPGQEGVQVSFVLPQAQAGVKRERVLPEPVGVIAGAGAETAWPDVKDLTGKRVVLIDEEALNLELLGEILRRQGFKVEGFRDGMMAVEAVLQEPPDLIVLDVNLHGSSGYEICRRIRHVYNAIEMPILLLTGRSDPEDLMAGFQAGASDYLTKPVNLDTFYTRIRAHLRIQELAAEVKAKQEQLTQTAKLAVVGELVTDLAHELNNPLHLIQGYFEVFVDSLKQIHPEFAQKEDLSVQEINRNIDRMVGYIRHFREFSRTPEAQFAATDLNHVVENAFLLFRSKIHSRQISVLLNLDQDPPRVWGHSMRLEQILVNLISNSLDVLQARGTLTVSTGHQGKETFIHFHDNGPGIAKEHLGRLFQPFFTTKPPGKGTGLGLSICAAIAQEHGGRLECQSVLGQGTTFILYLPSLEGNLGTEPQRSAA